MTARYSALWLLLLPSGAAGQAPPAADLWRVGATTLARPAALEAGPTALFWNPSATQSAATLSVGIHAVQTPGLVGLSGLLAGATRRLPNGFGVGLILSRIEIRDLVRTTTSPAAIGGDIPVFAQAAGVVGSLAIGPARGAVNLRAHDARFDTEREGGVTVDAGLHLIAGSRLVAAVASQFAPITFRRGQTAHWHGAVEYALLASRMVGAPARVLARYGATLRGRGGVEHTFGAGVELSDRVQFDAAAVREVGFGQALWRPAVALHLRFGRYLISAARGGGANDVGATYRLGLDLDLTR